MFNSVIITFYWQLPLSLQTGIAFHLWNWLLVGSCMALDIVIFSFLFFLTHIVFSFISYTYTCVSSQISIKNSVQWNCTPTNYELGALRHEVTLLKCMESVKVGPIKGSSKWPWLNLQSWPSLIHRCPPQHSSACPLQHNCVACVQSRVCTWNQTQKECYRKTHSLGSHCKNR